MCGKRPWTTREIRLLCRFYPTVGPGPTTVLLSRLGFRRSIRAVERMAARHGLRVGLFKCGLPRRDAR